MANSDNSFKTAGSVKIFMFPDSYNNLRKELNDNWPKQWEVVQWSMAFDAPLFVELMNRALDFRIEFKVDGDYDIDTICTRYLTELRKRRGAA